MHLILGLTNVYNNVSYLVRCDGTRDVTGKCTGENDLCHEHVGRERQMIYDNKVYALKQALKNIKELEKEIEDMADDTKCPVIPHSEYFFQKFVGG